jgi:hypothetical protein
MNTKRVLLSAAAVLVLTAFTPAAQAQYAPVEGAAYNCLYFDGSGTFVNGLSGVSVFTWNYLNGPTLKRGIEMYWLNNGTVDNRKMTFAYKAPGPNGTSKWEFTINPSGPQCKDTFVSAGGATISFNTCTDGHSRFCFR